MVGLGSRMLRSKYYVRGDPDHEGLLYQEQDWLPVPLTPTDRAPLPDFTCHARLPHTYHLPQSDPHPDAVLHC